MNCMSCRADIPPTFKHAISKNECASCGQPMMTDEAKTIMDELKDALQKMPNDPEGLAGWILSTYQITKISDVVPATFYTKKNKRAIESEDSSEEIGEEDENDPEFANKKDRFKKFLKRAAVPKLDSKDLKNKISTKSGIILDPSELDKINDDSEYYEDEEDDGVTNPELMKIKSSVSERKSEMRASGSVGLIKRA